MQHKVKLTMIALLLIATNTFAQAQYTVMSIEAQVDKQSTFVFAQNSPMRDTFYSKSSVIQQAVLAAFLSGRAIEFETEAGTKFIKRVIAFERGSGMDGYSRPIFIVARIATQRNAKTGIDHLEVFLKKGNDMEFERNVYDPLLQQLLMAAFQHDNRSSSTGFPLTDVQYDDEQIILVHVGEK